MPVTSKAQNSDVYQDYLSREGEDNDLYYDVKLQASKLLLRNTGNTFVTPVFNGSASLRNAAGQMIEEVVKSVRRKKEINEAYYETLYADMTSLHRLDQIETSAAGGKTEFGPLPGASVALLITLGAAWVLIALYVAFDALKKKKTAR